MKSIIKSKFKIIIPTVIIALILISIFMSKNIGRLSGMYGNSNNKNEQIPLFSYVVYDNQDSEAIKVLITVTSDSGIEYVETPDNKVYAGNKEKLSFDYLVKKDEGKIFKIKEVGKAEKEETLLITDESFKNILKIENVAEYNAYRTINVVDTMSLDGYKTYYKIGDIGTWQEGSGTVSLIYRDLRKDCLLNSDDTVTISAYMKNDKSGDIINISSEDFDVDTTYLTNFNIENRESCKADNSYDRMCRIQYS